MDTRRQHKSEQSKRRRNLRLTNRSTKPYPWPPKQAQPDVSKPGRSTVAVLAAVASAGWIAVLLYVLAAFLIAWGLEPKRTEAFVGRLPYGNYLLKALAKLDSMLSDRS
jgi:hypothetical protein